MHYPYTSAAQTRQALLAVYINALRAWAHGELIDAAELHRQADNILDDALAAHASRVINDIRPQGE